jgi:DNA-binding GntR family transcriptional regulator
MLNPISPPIRSNGDAVTARDVTDWVRECIRHGQFVPGQRLVEADIIREVGASRSKVRESFQRLETEGIVVIEEFRGASVKRLSFDEIRQIYRTRMALEGLAAGEFAGAEASELKARLREIQDQMNALENSGNHDRFAQLNGEWHSLIIEGSGNGYVAQFLARLTVPVYRLLFSTFYNTSRIDSANAGHRVVTTAIIEGRVEDAESAMRQHISEGLGALSEISAQYAH